MAQSVKMLVIETWGSEFRFPALMPDMMTLACDSSIEKAETEDSLDLVVSQSSQTIERSCLKN